MLIIPGLLSVTLGFLRRQAAARLFEYLRARLAATRSQVP